MQAATDNVAGAAPAGLLAQLGGVLVNGVGTWIDSEIAERIGGTPDGAQTREQNPQADATQPQVTTLGDIFQGITLVGAALVAVAAVVLWKVIK